MSKINDGGPVHLVPDCGHHGVCEHSQTLRQWYAGKALESFSMNAGLNFDEIDCHKFLEKAVKNAFIIADAMIAYEANEKKEE